MSKEGFNLRIKKCGHCGNFLIHPEDKAEYENFVRLKKKEYEVKMRMVGNSYAVSIPREIVDFMQEQEKIMNNMVKLCFHEMGKISLEFDSSEENKKSRVIKASEVKIVRNNKPVFHARKVYDSANPENNRTKIYKEEEE